MLLKNRTCWELVINRFQVQSTWKKADIHNICSANGTNGKKIWSGFVLDSFTTQKSMVTPCFFFLIWKRTEIFAVWTQSCRSVNADESVFTCQAFGASVHLTTWGHHYPNLSSSCHCVRFVSSPSSDKWLRAKCRACQYVSMAMEFAELGEDGVYCAKNHFPLKFFTRQQSCADFLLTDRDSNFSH